MWWPERARRHARPWALGLALALPLAAGAEPAWRAPCLEVADRLASVRHDDCAGDGFRLTGAHSVDGRPLFQRLLPAPVGGRTPLRVLLVGGIHGDELASVSVVFHWLRLLEADPAPRVTWNVVPALNPDGLLRRPARRVNSRGVDLNRNFPVPDWHRRALGEYWVERTGRSPRRYPGTDPLSEPESRWLAREIESFRPHAIVSVHAPHGVVDFDGPPRGPGRLGALDMKLLGAYPGSLGSYGGVLKRIPVITVELAYAGIMPRPEDVRGMWRDLRRWAADNLPKEDPPRFGFPALVWEREEAAPADPQAGPS